MSAHLFCEVLPLTSDCTAFFPVVDVSLPEYSGRNRSRFRALAITVPVIGDAGYARAAGTRQTKEN
jgi:hypothetical protein